jgi:hypothetical protein
MAPGGPFHGFRLGPLSGGGRPTSRAPWSLVDGRAVSQGRGLRGSPLAFLTLGPLRLCRRGPGGRRWASPVAAFRGVFSRGAAAVRLRLLFPGRGSLETVLLRGPPLLVGGGCRWPRRPPPAAAAPRGSPPPAPSSPAGDHRPSGSAPSSLSSSAGRHLILGGGSPRPLLPPWTATAPRGRLPSTPPSPRGGGGCPRPCHPPPHGGVTFRPLSPAGAAGPPTRTAPGAGPLADATGARTRTVQINGKTRRT